MPREASATAATRLPPGVPSLRLLSNDGECVDIESDGDSWLVSLSGPDLSASARADYGGYYPAGRVAAFFDDLALNWRGWTDEKTWRSSDDQLRFAASHDGLGHVTLRATLRDRDWPGEVWTVELLLRVDAGALEAIASDVAAFDQA